MHQALAMKLEQACHFVLQWKEGQLKLMLVSKREKARSEYFKKCGSFFSSIEPPTPQPKSSKE